MRNPIRSKERVAIYVSLLMLVERYRDGVCSLLFHLLSARVTVVALCVYPSVTALAASASV